MAVEGTHDANIYLSSGNGSIKLNSIQNVSFNQNVQETPALVVGQSISPTTIDGPTQTKVSVDKILNNNDFIRTLTGKSDISGQFEYGDNFLSFNKTCLNNFSVSATINELPQASFDFTIYGSLSGTSNSLSSTAVSDNTTEEIIPEGLLVTFDKQSTNAVQSFNYSEVINKQATYGIGSKEPSDIQTVGPILQEASIAIEVEDYEPEETFSFLSGSKDRNRTIKMEISGENSILNTFQLENGYLVSESVGVGVGGTTVANLNYRGYKKLIAPENFSLKIKKISKLPFSLEGENIVFEANGLSLINTTNISFPGVINTITSRETEKVAGGGFPHNASDFESQSSDSVADSLQMNIDYQTPAGNVTYILTELGTITGQIDPEADSSAILEFTCLHDNNDGSSAGFPSATGEGSIAGWNYGEPSPNLSTFASFLSFKEDWSQNIILSQSDENNITLRQDAQNGYPSSSEIDFMDGARFITTADDSVYGLNAAGLTQGNQSEVTHSDMNDPRITKVRIKLTNLRELNNKTLWLPQFRFISTA